MALRPSWSTAGAQPGVGARSTRRRMPPMKGVLGAPVKLEGRAAAVTGKFIATAAPFTVLITSAA